MSAPTFVGVTDGRNGTPDGTGSLTLGVPSGAANDLLVAVVGVKTNPSTATPAGWTPIIAGFNACVSGSDPQIGIRAQLSTYWKVSDGSETSVTFNFGAGVIHQAAGAVLRYSGVDTANPIDASGCDKGTSTSPTAPSVTTTVADDRVLRVAVADSDDSKSLFTSEPSAARFEIASTSVFGPGSSSTGEAVVVAGADGAQAAAGPTGTAAWTLPAADQWAAQTVAIRPVGGGGNGGTDAEGCGAVIVAVIRKLLDRIIGAIEQALEKLRNRKKSRSA